MVPMACQVGSAVVIPKEKKRKKGDGWMDGWMNLRTDGWPQIKTFVTFRPTWPLIHKINEKLICEHFARGACRSRYA
jgi:hypothetical protein